MPVAAAGACALATLSLLLPSAPGYDPLAWLVWGREVAALELDTTSGPAWKPLPVLVTTAVSPAGDAAVSLWLVVARAGGLLAAFMAWRVASRLAAGLGALAGAGAVTALMLTDGLVRGVALGHSEGLLLAFALLGLDRHLDGRRGQALAFGAVTALLRVEVWPFLAVYAALFWRGASARGRRAIAGVALGVVALWFLPDLWGSGDLLRSSERARVPNPGAPALADRPALEVVARLGGMVSVPLALVAAACLAYAARRCQRPTVVVGAAGAAWLVVVAAMSEFGYAGEERYLLPGAGAIALLAGVGLAGGLSAVAGCTPARLRAAAAAGAAALVALAIPALPAARETASDLAHAAALHSDLRDAVADAGGSAALRSCGPAFTGRYRFPAVAWRLGIHISDVGMMPGAHGVVLRSRLTRRSKPEPAFAVATRSAARARAGTWSVYTRCRAEADPGPGAPALALVRVAEGLETPVDVVAAPGERDRLYVVEQPGRVRILENGVLRRAPFLDVTGLVSTGGEQGLLGLEFHPDYPRTRRFVVHYTDTSGDTRIVEYRSDGRRALPRTARPLLFVEQPYENHNGGQIAFGSDGLLYAALGDGGSAFDPEGRAQNPGSLLGKLVRLDVDRRRPRPRVVAYGLRNPWRFAFDRATGDAYVADVGQDEWEEVNVIPAGTSVLLNFGWDVYEGRERIDAKSPRPTGALAWPIAAYRHGADLATVGQGGECSIIGGVVYRGSALRRLAGRYLYGDYCSGVVWSLRWRRGETAGEVRRETVELPGLTTFGEDADGEVYLASQAGDVYRLADGH
ncbi:MAG TPA: PQQ-dependent sugar dehydrogenase [Gaiellaceae bacterium]|nr:PQQ-dependent sugar dehydrogenase [Gaiellaceae bacterium]